MTLRYKLAAAVLAALAFTSAPAAPQEVPAIEAKVQELLLDSVEARNRNGNQNEWFQQHRNQITQEIADTAYRMAERNLADSKLKELGTTLLGFATHAYFTLGQYERGLDTAIRMFQEQFQMAEKPEEYRSIRQGALSLVAGAQKIPYAEGEFRLLVLAADCTYFEGDNPQDGKRKGEWLEAMLRDIEPALQKATAGRSQAWQERLASMTSAVVGATIAEYFLNEEKIQELLKKVTPLLDSAFAADFEYRPNAGGPEKTVQTAVHFARASFKYGYAAAGDGRLAIAAERALRQGDRENYLNLVYERYRNDRFAGRPPLLLQRLRDNARQVAQQVRGKYRSRAGRIWSGHEMDTAYGEMLRDELRDVGSAPPNLFAAAETLKARTLLDDLAAPPAPIGTAGQTERVAALERRILGFEHDDTSKDDLYMTETKLLSHLSSFSAIAMDPEARGEALAELEKSYAASKTGYSSVAGPAALEEVRRALGPSEAILEYVIPYNELHPASELGIMLIARDRILVAPLDLEKVLGRDSSTGRISVDGKAPMDLSPLGDGVTQMRVAIRSANEKRAKELLNAFYSLLIAPLIEKGFAPEQYSRLIIVPHGPLQYVPFAALMDEHGVPLIKKTAVTMAPSASVWRLLLSRNAPVEKWVAYASPSLAAGLPTLASSQKEAERISAIVTALHPVVKTGGEATAQNLAADAPTAGILHIATHGAFPDENALDDHALLLSASAGGDGILRASTVRHLPLQQTRLVVLSVCNGGLYRMGPTDEPYGLVPAFLEAGAQNVMATLWPMDDIFGRSFTVEFYKHLAKDGPAEALRQTTLHFFGEDELVRRWAGFVMVGPGRPLEYR